MVTLPAIIHGVAVFAEGSFYEAEGIVAIVLR